MSNSNRDSSGKFAQNPEPPLVDFKVTNPATYLRIWWNKIFSNEGIDLKLRIHPLTAIAFAFVLVIGGYGAGRVSISSQNPIIIKYLPQLIPTPTPGPWQDAAYTGILMYSKDTGKYYLESDSNKMIILNIPQNMDLTKYIGKRILAEGQLNNQTGILLVTAASDMEVLPVIPQLVPTLYPLPTSEISPAIPLY